ncbi:MAG TPA: SigB/SigF/SigG family RNA polymerase sigma factor [Solirubrobacteraceae bacterium]|nr:SigB/SigF/SigG family RNA polymerase sigma factor [Solirubrobacteraceae bacterium]
MSEVAAVPQQADVPEEVTAEDVDRRGRTDRMLFARRDAGDPRARDELVARFLPLARSLARRYEHSGEPFEDLMQVASIALVKAVDRYDPQRGFAFSSFAVPTIVGELKRHFRDRTWTVRPPRAVQELALRVEGAAARLWQQLDRAPTVPELAETLGCSDEEVMEAMQARGARGALSLQAPAGGRDDDFELGDTFGISETGYELAEMRAELDSLLTGITPRARTVLRLRFEHDLTQAEIGLRLGVSQMQVSRIIRQALEQLRVVADEREELSVAVR